MNPTLPTIYMVPGLGADGRLFQPLKAEGLPIQVLEFIPPIKGESLRSYAHRLAQGIDTSKPFVVGGVSLGGIMASEIADITQPQKLLLISTVKTSREFPCYFKLGRYLPVYRLFSADFMRKHAPRERTGGMKPEIRKILNDMRRDADLHFIEWSVDAVVRWRRKKAHPQLVHLHGTRDWMFPGILLGPRERIRGGGHTMVMTHAPQVADWIRRQL